MLATTTTLFLPYIDLHDTKKKLDQIWGENRLPIVTIEGKKGRSALLRLLINDYVKGQVPHTLHSYIKHSHTPKK